VPCYATVLPQAGPTGASLRAWLGRAAKGRWARGDGELAELSHSSTAERSSCKSERSVGFHPMAGLGSQAGDDEPSAGRAGGEVGPWLRAHDLARYRLPSASRQLARCSLSASVLSQLGEPTGHAPGCALPLPLPPGDGSEAGAGGRSSIAALLGAWPPATPCLCDAALPAAPPLTYGEVLAFLSPGGPADLRRCGIGGGDVVACVPRSNRAAAAESHLCIVWRGCRYRYAAPGSSLLAAVAFLCVFEVAIAAPLDPALSAPEAAAALEQLGVSYALDFAAVARHGTRTRACPQLCIVALVGYRPPRGCGPRCARCRPSPSSSSTRPPPRRAASSSCRLCWATR
jgi:hypothetical protein